MSATSLAKSAPNIANSFVGDVAVTVAVLGRVLKMAASPKIAGPELGEHLTLARDGRAPGVDDEEEVAGPALGAEVVADVGGALLELGGDRGTLVVGQRCEQRHGGETGRIDGHHGLPVQMGEADATTVPRSRRLRSPDVHHLLARWSAHRGECLLVLGLGSAAWRGSATRTWATMPSLSMTKLARFAQPSCSLNTPYALATAPWGQKSRAPGT